MLGYLLPPLELYQDLLTGELGFTSWLFLGVATTLFTIDFLFARHLFCKFGCALGVFQSLVWMMNPKALMVSFDASRAALCKDCDKACDKACPMRLLPAVLSGRSLPVLSAVNVFRPVMSCRRITPTAVCFALG